MCREFKRQRGNLGFDVLEQSQQFPTGERSMSDKNIQIVKDIYAAFNRGDVPAIMQHMSDDLQGFGVVSEEKLIPWHIQISKKRMYQSFSKL
jgi:hypothetical protein